MEPVLINRYRFDEDSLRASYRQVLRPVQIIQLCLSVFLLGASIRYTLVLRELFAENLILPVMVLFLYLLAGLEAYRALTAVKRATKQALTQMETAKGVRAYDVILRFEKTELVTESELSPQPQHKSYDSFKKLRRGKELIVIRTRSRLVYALDPNRFENGSEADFWKLMNEVCPAAVPKQYKTL